MLQILSNLCRCCAGRMIYATKDTLILSYTLEIVTAILIKITSYIIRSAHIKYKMIYNTLVYIIKYVMIYAHTDCSIRVVHSLEGLQHFGRLQVLVSYKPSACAAQPK